MQTMTVQDAARVGVLYGHDRAGNARYGMAGGLSDAVLARLLRARVQGGYQDRITTALHILCDARPGMRAKFMR